MLNLFRSLVACGVISAITVAGYAQNPAAPEKVEPRPKQNTPSLKRDKDGNPASNRPQQPREGQDAQNQQADRGGKKHLDHYAAACTVNENQNEVAIAQLAAKKSQNPEVKAFAEMLVKDHTAFIEKLRPFESGREQSGAADGARNEQRRQGDDQPDNRTARNAAPRDDANRDAAERPASPRVDEGGVQVQVQAQGRRDGQMKQGHGGIPVQTLVQISDEIAKRCLTSAQRELNAKQGSEFDLCFMGMQIGAHTKMVDSLSVVQNHVSPELQQILSEGVETSQRHLTEAKKIHETLEKNHASQTAGAEKEKRQ